MDGKKVNNHFHFGDVASVLVLILIGVGTLGYLLYRGVAAGGAVAYVVLGGIVFMLVAGIGVATTLFIMRQVVKAEERRALVEQSRWRDNTSENLQIMTSMQRVQNQQHTLLQRQAIEAQRAALSAPEADVIDAAGFQFTDTLFDEIEVGD